MTEAADVVELTKRCSRCGEVKNAVAFYRNAKAKDGLTAACGACINAAVKARQAVLRETDPEGYARAKREAVARSRQKPKAQERERRQSRAYTTTISRLIANHRREYEELYRLAKWEQGLR